MPNPPEGGPDQVLAVAQMRAAEDALIAAGSSVDALMEIAGQGVAEWAWRLGGPQRITVLCGPGNNGGDGYVAARLLRERGADVRVIASGEPRTDAAHAARALFAGEVLGPEMHASGDVLIDCLFGSGLSRPLQSEHVALLGRLAESHRHRIAVDVPSGVDADSGNLLNEGLPSYDLTLALGAWKPAQYLMPASARMGAIRRVPIGVGAVPGAAQVLLRPHLSAPDADAHKYRRGLVSVVGGAMPGAAAMAAEAALRSGAGYVRLGTSQPARTSHAIVRTDEPTFDKARAILIGPGLGRGEEGQALLHAALTAGVPVVADADTLWLLGEAAQPVTSPPAIVTPHEGEFVRLYGGLGGSKIDRAKAAARGGSVVVYKGADTVIAAPDGRVALAPRATSWLSIAGTGDVLSGICASRLAVTGDPFRAACEAVWLHGEAAHLAGPAFAADDLIACIPLALAACL